MIIRITSQADIDGQIEVIRAAAEQARLGLMSAYSDGLTFFRALKFDPIGRHPIEPRDLNVIEQVNQTFTYLVALEAARFLLERHPEAGGFLLAPGAHMSMPLDIMSIAPGLVGAETFAAVDPRNNRKLAKDLAKLAQHTEEHRYVFFASPLFPGHQRWEALELPGVEVWSVTL